MFRFFYVISIFLHIGVLFSQSINDLQKLRSDYERLKNQNSTTNSESFDIDRSISPIMDEVLTLIKILSIQIKPKTQSILDIIFLLKEIH